MDEENIELFNCFVGELLARLSDKFPVEENISVDEFSYFKDANHDIFFSSIRFLRREGFIYYSEQVYGGFIDVVLTAKGLTVINSIPEILKDKESTGKKISGILKSGSSEVIKVILREITKLSIGL